MKLLFTAVFTLITVVISPSTTHRIADTPEEGDLRIDINKSNIAPIDDKNAIPEQEPNVETPSSMEGDEEEKKESDLDGNVTECSMETESVIPLEESDITIVGYDDNGSSYIQQQVNSFSFSQDVNVPYKSDKGFRPQYNRPARRNTGKIPVRPNSRAPLSSNRVSNPHIRTTTSQKPIRLLQTGTNRGNRHRPRQRRRRNVNGSGNRRRVQPKTQNNRDIRKPQNNGSDLQKSGESKAYARQTLPREDNDDTDNVVDAEEKPVIKRRLTERNSYGNGILDADEETSRELLKQLTRHFDEDDGVAPVSARPARSPPRSRMTLRTPNVVKGYPVKFTNRDVESRLDDDDIEKALEAMESEQNTETNNTSNKTGPIDPMDSVFSHDTDGSSDDDEGDDMDNDVGPYFSSQSREMDNAKRSTVNGMS
ncbi:uncharacterized protein BXIN_1762 [Babesia sp. Xinjiang]|uniref:uncharacterized protein n=1 Tax=Babesia sp. Xinjiang TaxID=462227 RepID=UPI000A2217AA|nr:uncharacterized protein BXIN_1657 [Babesia sp. Xinjiang]XP_028871456.1 uncharacterized protein BXIN_1762 [Babesia sp. Xinjiang]ORM40874.1 hypothetical protein BXIN_1657 [Babesia sp. Xinjiang]ORM41000.1 hypothetical protein BXIN_1762 [Babesia sp. Xinjiang]